MKIEENIKKEFEERLFEKIDTIYWDICNSKNRKMIESESYREYNELCNGVLVRNSKILRVIEDQSFTSLTKEDVKDLIEYLRNDYSRKLEEDKYLMIQVAKETYLLLKKFGMIKDIDE